MSGSSWIDQLQPASWRGVPFGVDSSSVRRGRRTAVHEYPYRDQVWVEDLGRGVRGVAFSGFLVGDDCYDQRDAMLAMAEIPDSGELVHPSLGTLIVSLIGPIEASERKELGRVVELRFEFIETADPIYPSADDDTAGDVDDDADDADDASGSDFLSSVGDALDEGAQVVAAGLSTVSGFVSQVGALAGDASLVVSAVSGLPGNFGRFSSGARGSVLGGFSATGPGFGPGGGVLGQIASTAFAVQGAIGAVVVAGAAVGMAADTVSELAGEL